MQPYEHLIISSEKKISIIEINHPPVNTVSSQVRQELFDAITDEIHNTDTKAIVLTSVANTPFSAGADIKEFATYLNSNEPLENDFYKLCHMIKKSKKPVIAAIEQYALGGGLELAMMCHYRVCSGQVKLGLPEVNIGILPGGGGTQLLPRLVGYEDAIQIICTGKTITAKQALNIGLINAYESDIGAKKLGLKFAKKVVSAKLPDKATPCPEMSRDAKLSIQAKIKRQARGNHAPVLALEALLCANQPLEEGLAEEQRLFETLLKGEQSQAMRYLFFSERMALHVPNITPVKDPNIKQIGIIGGGLMGSGIAMCCLQKGIPTLIIEQDKQALKLSKDKMQAYYEDQVKKGKISQEKAEKNLKNISYHTDMTALTNVDCVIEAAYENMAVKQDIFSSLSSILKPDTLVATNTSALNIDQIAQCYRYPEQVMGLHFFSPAQIMPLLEVVRGQATKPEVLARGIALGKLIKKKPVTVKVCDGFVGNRMIFKYIEQAVWLLMNGIDYQNIDKIIYEFGMPMGPFVMSDMSGLDLSVKKDPEGQSIFHSLCKEGRLGQKTKAGFYDYHKDPKKPQHSETTERIIQNHIKDHHPSVQASTLKPSHEHILKRMLYQLINEAVNILSEGIANRGSDIDIIYVYGYGWPPYKGGPLWYADSIGIENVYRDILRFKDEDQALGHDQWHISPLWESLIQQGKKLSQYQAET